MRWLTALALLALPSLIGAAAPAVTTAPAVLKLIDQLGSEDTDTRKAAEKKLEELGEDILPALLAASKKHPDIDTRLRAMVVARNIRARHWGPVKAIGPGASLTAYPFGGGYWLNRVRFSHDSKYAIAAGGGLILYEIATGKEIGRTLEVGGARPGLDLSKDGKHVLTGHASANATEFHLVEIPSLKTVQTFKGHKSGFLAVALSPDGKTAASASSDGTVRLWSIETGKEQGQLPGLPTSATCVAFSPDGKQVMTGHGTVKGYPQIRLFDVQTRKQVKSYTLHKENATVTGVRFRPDKKTAVSSCNQGQVILWEVGSGKKLQTMNNVSGVNDLALSPDGKRALTAGVGDAKVKLWELDSGKLLETFEGHLGTAVLGVAFSRDGRQALSTDTINCVRVWKMGR
jgi:WD40 repeat protein